MALRVAHKRALKAVVAAIMLTIVSQNDREQLHLDPDRNIRLCRAVIHNRIMDYICEVLQ